MIHISYHLKKFCVCFNLQAERQAKAKLLALQKLQEHQQQQGAKIIILMENQKTNDITIRNTIIILKNTNHPIMTAMNMKNHMENHWPFNKDLVKRYYRRWCECQYQTSSS
ncbi:hypothetical protein CEXT_256021 [Caerostris extrusa]|uniref:Uncharacterized protein n=1 Tax=Caerostris extrusa TaxID=172846 RepID=A0AAV4M671_CAEEX|nr:hypothetical protein CEXT_256021 [Caerostris extrusa]